MHNSETIIHSDTTENNIRAIVITEMRNILYAVAA